jgi:hypothetical protein
MTQPTQQLDARLRRDLVIPIDPAERDALWDRVVAHEPVASERVRSRRPRRSHRVLSVVIALVLIGGSALAYGADRLLSISDDDAPVSRRIDQFQREDVPRATPGEYARLQSLIMVPVADHTGIVRPNDMHPLYVLAPRDRSRVLADDPRVGRLIAVPTVGDTVTCYLYASPGNEGVGSGGCTDKLPATGLSVTRGFVGNAYVIDGFAVDDVTRVDVELAGGRTVEVPLVSNVIRWRIARTPANRPVRIITKRGDRTCSEDIQVDPQHTPMSPPPAPSCVPTDG